MVIVLMGVAGSGKTTIGRRLARQLGWSFYEGDDFHPASNVEKMAQGIPLTDEDRAPWLAILRSQILEILARDESAVFTCSALKQKYREQLLHDHKAVHFVYLEGEYDLIRRRLEQRRGHYMKEGLLQSQFDALEEPDAMISMDISQPREVIVDAIIAKLDLNHR